MTIVSLLPSATETVFGLRLGDQLEGVTDACDWLADRERSGQGKPGAQAARKDRVGVKTRALALALATVILAGCGVVEIAEVETPDPAAIPSGSPEAPDATGPISEVGSGVTRGVGWRYLVYPGDEGWCTQLETSTVTETGCGRGEIVPQDGSAFGSVSHGGAAIHGVATADTATVWLIGDDGTRVPAILLPLDDAGLDAVGFVGILPAGVTASHVMAVRMNGEVLETLELP